MLLNEERIILGKVETLPCYHGTRGTTMFRTPDSIDEMDAHCSAHSHIWFRTIRGDARQAKVNGAVRRWKRDRTRIEVPVKYGLRECYTMTQFDISRVLIPVSTV